jgi:drug/metabolite transporter (DMT)-like permease
MNKSKANASLGASLIILSSFFYASYGIWTTLMGNFFGGYTASALRSIIVLIIFIPIALSIRAFEPLQVKKNWKYLFGMVFTAFFIWGPLYYSILHAGIGMALTINYASIVIGMFFFGWLFAGEKFTKDKWLSAALGLLGLGLVFIPSQSQLVWLALGAAVVSGVGTAAAMVLIKLIPYNATQASIVSWTSSVIANTIMMVLIRESAPAFGLHIQWAYLVLFAVASIAASWLFARGVKLVEAGAAGVLGLLEIVFGILFGVLFFHEKPAAISLVGAGIIMVAAALPYLRIKKLS